MNWRERIVSDPRICRGIPCFKGTRVFVSIVLDNLAEGASREEILESYPSLAAEDIDAAVAYAADVVRRRRKL